MQLIVYFDSLKQKFVTDELKRLGFEVIPHNITSRHTVVVKCPRSKKHEVESIDHVNMVGWIDEPEDYIVCPKCHHKIEV